MVQKQGYLRLIHATVRVRGRWMVLAVGQCWGLGLGLCSGKMTSFSYILYSHFVINDQMTLTKKRHFKYLLTHTISHHIKHNQINQIKTEYDFPTFYLHTQNKKSYLPHPKSDQEYYQYFPYLHIQFPSKAAYIQL